MAKIVRDNGLTIVLMLLFLASVVGHLLTGWHVSNEDALRHHEAALGLVAYAASPHFISTLFENWESEFLQMSAYVVLTAYLYQRGSAESKDPDAPPRDDDLAGQGSRPGAPAMLRAGAAARWVYAHSLGLTLFALFLASFVLHWRFSAAQAAAEAIGHGEVPQSPAAYLFSAELWFESFQNWQSEFLSTAVIVVLSIFLRQKESPESKAVAAPHGDTGA